MATLSFDREFLENVKKEMESKGYRVEHLTIGQVITYVESQVK